MINQARDAEVRRLHDHLTVDEIAGRFRLSRRTVFRILTPHAG